MWQAQIFSVFLVYLLVKLVVCLHTSKYLSAIKWPNPCVNQVVGYVLGIERIWNSFILIWNRTAKINDRRLSLSMLPNAVSVLYQS